jgi:predicted nuclease with RNAse H fold
MTSPSQIVAGVDVGGPKKGFHGVALRDGQYWAKFTTHEAADMADWCKNAVRASVIGIDAPCRWSTTGRARPAERALAKDRISCFATPTLEAAQSNPFYGWMKNGAELFRLVEIDFPLFEGEPVQNAKPICFETFPHAAACALAGEAVPAKQKAKLRRELLVGAGVDVAALSNIDMVDAALCALAASYFLAKQYKKYGEPASGFIIVPDPKLESSTVRPIA